MQSPSPPPHLPPPFLPDDTPRVSCCTYTSFCRPLPLLRRRALQRGEFRCVQIMRIHFLSLYLSGIHKATHTCYLMYIESFKMRKVKATTNETNEGIVISLTFLRAERKRTRDFQMKSCRRKFSSASQVLREDCPLRPGAVFSFNPFFRERTASS